MHRGESRGAHLLRAVREQVVRVDVLQRGREVASIRPHDERRAAGRRGDLRGDLIEARAAQQRAVRRPARGDGAVTGEARGEDVDVGVAIVLPHHERTAGPVAVDGRPPLVEARGRQRVPVRREAARDRPRAEHVRAVQVEVRTAQVLPHEQRPGRAVTRGPHVGLVSARAAHEDTVGGEPARQRAVTVDPQRIHVVVAAAAIAPGEQHAPGAIGHHRGHGLIARRVAHHVATVGEPRRAHAARGDVLQPHVGVAARALLPGHEHTACTVGGDRGRALRVGTGRQHEARTGPARGEHAGRGDVLQHDVAVVRGVAPHDERTARAVGREERRGLVRRGGREPDAVVGPAARGDTVHRDAAGVDVRVARAAVVLPREQGAAAAIGDHARVVLGAGDRGHVATARRPTRLRHARRVPAHRVDIRVEPAAGVHPRHERPPQGVPRHHRLILILCGRGDRAAIRGPRRERGGDGREAQRQRERERGRAEGVRTHEVGSRWCAVRIR